MNLGQFVSILSQRCDNRSDLETRIKTEVSFVQSTVLEGTGAFLPWFLQSDETLIVAAEGEALIDFPVGFLAEIEDNIPWIENSDGTRKKLIKKEYDYIRERRPDPGQPEYYTAAAGGFYLGPIPDAAYNIYMRYYKAADTLVEDADTNSWLTYASDLFLAEVGAVIARTHIRDMELMQIFREDASIARTRLYTLDVAKSSVNRRYGMGED